MTIPGHCRGPAEDYAFADEEFEKIRAILLMERRFDPGIYKERYMKRRITIRIRATDCGSAAEYRSFLERNDTEIDRLLRVLTIHVSQFFRNASTFEALREDILPRLFRRAEEEDAPEVVFWSAGCAGGEEPYTLALVLRESFPQELERRRVAIVATDVDPEVLEKARSGLFGPERLAELPPELLERHFVQEGNRFLLSPEIRERVEFRRGDLLDTRLYPRCDLILCRNVLIYFERGQQEKILDAFAESLPDSGVLVLGRSETLFGNVRKRFDCISPAERIYRKIH